VAQSVLTEGRNRIDHFARSAAPGSDASLIDTRPAATDDSPAQVDPPRASPVLAEVARVGQSGRLAATLAVLRLVRAVGASSALRSERVRAFQERLGLRAAALDGLLAQAQAGGENRALDASIRGAIEATYVEIQSLFAAVGGAAFATASAIVAPAFVSVAQVGRVLDEVAERLGDRARKPRGGAGAGSAAGDGAASALTTRSAELAVVARALEQAAVTVTPDVSRVRAEPPARSPLFDEGHKGEKEREKEGAHRRTEMPKERPANWELHVTASSTEVGLESIARALGVGRLEDVRDVLSEGLTRRHQFVIWTQVGTRLAEPVRALVDQGLIETRVSVR
jgi:hypothetical protein